MHRFALVCLFALATVSEVSFAGEENTTADEIFVAVGYGGRRMISTDGQTWKITEEWAQPGKDDSNNLMGLVFAKGKFVAVGGGGGGKTAGGHVLISTDGETWREVWAAPSRINPIEFGGERFLVGGPRKTLYWSTDAETWTAGAKLTDKRCTHFRHAAYGKGIFVVTGNNGGRSPAWIAITKNGEAVDHVTFDIPSIRDIAFGDGTFVVVGEGVRIASTDGRVWKPTGLPAEEKLTWVVHTGDEFLCGGHGSTYSSEDGMTWTKRQTRFRGHIKWTDGKRFISTSWPGKMFHSPDGGQTWKPGNTMTANGINRVVRGRN